MVLSSNTLDFYSTFHLRYESSEEICAYCHFFEVVSKYK